MKTMKFLRLTLILLAVLSLASCSKEARDGDWAPMIWGPEVPVQKTDGVYLVPETGAEFTFSCRNYSGPWMSSASSRDERYTHDANDYHTISADWFKAETSGNKLRVIFKANETDEERPLQLVVTVGDIFFTFRFRQFAHQ